MTELSRWRKQWEWTIRQIAEGEYAKAFAVQHLAKCLLDGMRPMTEELPPQERSAPDSLLGPLVTVTKQDGTRSSYNLNGARVVIEQLEESVEALKQRLEQEVRTNHSLSEYIGKLERHLKDNGMWPEP